MDGASNLDATIAHIQAFGDALSSAENANDLFKRMMKLDPNRVNPFVAWMSASLVFAATHSHSQISRRQTNLTEREELCKAEH